MPMAAIIIATKVTTPPNATMARSKESRDLSLASSRIESTKYSIITGSMALDFNPRITDAPDRVSSRGRYQLLNPAPHASLSRNH